MEVGAANVSTVSVRFLDGCSLKHAMEVGGGSRLGSRVQVDVSRSKTIHRLPSSANGCFSGGDVSTHLSLSTERLSRSGRCGRVLDAGHVRRQTSEVDVEETRKKLAEMRAALAVEREWRGSRPFLGKGARLIRRDCG